MAITNTAKTSSSLVNTAKISNEEIWGSNTTTWGTETRSWGDMGSKINNTARQSSSITNTSKPA